LLLISKLIKQKTSSRQEALEYSFKFRQMMPANRILSNTIGNNCIIARRYLFGNIAFGFNALKPLNLLFAIHLVD